MTKYAPDKSVPATGASSEQASSFASAEHAHEMAAILGLSIKPEWEDSVATNLSLLELAAEQVLAFDLPDDIEPAIVFSAK